MNKPIAIIMGSDSDLPVLESGIQTLNDFGIGFHLEVVSAHRTPEEMIKFGKGAADEGFKVIIAAAGGAAHLPGMVASVTILPVIGIPVNITSLDGIDSLLSIMQMPKGVPVATVSIDNSQNAALLALRILGIHDKEIQAKLLSFQSNQKIKVKKANEKLKRS